MHRSMLVSRFARRKAFTLVELMIVVVIVAILAAIAFPIYRGSLNEARLSEGIGGVGSIHSACRVKMSLNALETGMTLEDLGFDVGDDGDLDTRYFDADDYNLNVTAPDAYTISVTLPGTNLVYEIDQDGNETENSTITTGDIE